MQTSISLRERHFLKHLFVSEASCGRDNHTFVMTSGFKACMDESFSSRLFQPYFALAGACVVFTDHDQKLNVAMPVQVNCLTSLLSNDYILKYKDSQTL